MNRFVLLFLAVGILAADTWMCVTINGTLTGITPSMSNCGPISSGGGGTIQQTAQYSLQPYSLQTSSNSGEPIGATFTGTGVCVSSLSPYPDVAPSFGAGSSTYVGTSVVWTVPVANASPNVLKGWVWSGTLDSSVNQTYNTGVNGQCQCYVSDCCNPARGGQCPATCPPHSCQTKCGGDDVIPNNPAQEASPDSVCTPILISALDKGFHLSDTKDGVLFDVFGTGEMIPISWTTKGSGDGWLALPDPATGTVTRLSQLFGNLTPQPPAAHPNGFLALAVYDQPLNGGNADGIISAEDEVWSKLRVWVDSNHDGISQPDELLTMEQAGIVWISLEHRFDPHTDQWGNVYGLEGGLCRSAGKQTIWDVWLR